MAKRRFQFVGGNSSKFWEVEVSGTDAVIRFGRIGADGTVQVKSFTTTGGADQYARKMIDEKLRKGYSEVDARPSPTADRAAAAVRRTTTSTPATEPAPLSTVPAGPRRRAVRLQAPPQ